MQMDESIPLPPPIEKKKQHLLRAGDAKFRERERIAWAMRVEGATTLRIAEVLGISQPAVTKILHRVEFRIGEFNAQSAERVRALQAEQLERLIDECWMSWEKSKQPVRKVSKTQLPDGSHQTTVRHDERVGDPRFLDKILSSMAALRDLTGASAAQRIDITHHVRALAEARGWDPEVLLGKVDDFLAEQRRHGRSA